MPRPDRLIQVRFSRKRTSGATPQTATIILCRDQCSESPPIGRRFRALTTSSNLGDTAPTPTITNGPRGIQFFAGSADDPFFFDIPGFNRFVTSVLAGAANPALLQRGRDSFAGYNTLVIAFSFPVSFFGPLANNTLGATARVFNPSVTRVSRQQIDRVATPGVNVGFVPLDLDDVQNRSSTVQNTRGRIPAAIVETLRALGTNDAGIASLADLVVTRGDFVRVNTTIPNTGPGGGNNAGAGFPNGRRPVDDVIDTTLFIVTNGKRSRPATTWATTPGTFVGTSSRSWPRLSSRSLQPTRSVPPTPRWMIPPRTERSPDPGGLAPPGRWTIGPAIKAAGPRRLAARSAFSVGQHRRIRIYR